MINGIGECVWVENSKNTWIFEGKMVDKKPNGIVRLENTEKKKTFIGRFENGMRNGKAIMNIKGKEFYVLFENGIENKKKRERTFQGFFKIIFFNFF